MIGNVLVWIVFGALAGWIASMISRTDEQNDVIQLKDILMGIIGALVGGLIVQTVADSAGGLNVAGLLVAVFGAAILIGLYKTITPQN
jgi:uncharacterized membrane protein YeaQ/YmgE (transglycosylase-associated protein family)